MAVTLTLEQLADHMRLDRAAIASGDPRRTILVELLQACTERVELYAPDAGRDTQNLAVTVFAAYIFDGPPQRGGAPGATNAFVFSGARAMLALWRAPVSAVVGDGGVSTTTPTVTTPTPTPTPPPTPTPTPAATRYFGTRRVRTIPGVPPVAAADTIFSESEYLNGVEFTGLRFRIPDLAPATPLLNAYVFGIAVPEGEEITSIIFEQGNQDTTHQWRQLADIAIGGETYHQWVSSRTAYFQFLGGFYFIIVVTVP